MSTNRFSAERDRTADRSTPSGGHAMTFRCAACAGVRLVQGRKLQRVQGLRQFVCKGCVK
jgi:hypothetical protein